jgi:hypothetical protein
LAPVGVCRDPDRAVKRVSPNDGFVLDIRKRPSIPQSKRMAAKSFALLLNEETQMISLSSYRRPTEGLIVALLITGIASAMGCGDADVSRQAARPEGNAITFGVPDGTRHPYTVDVLLRLTLTAPWLTRCSGILLAPNIVTTAGHCRQAFQGRPHGQVGVTFDSVLSTGSRVIIGEFILHPAFTRGTLPLHDSAVVVLDEPVLDVSPARLSPVGLLDAMAAAGLLDGRKFDSVGYGTDESFAISTTGTRKIATGTFVSLSPSNLLLSQDPNNGDGGTCAFDSGGPILFTGTNIVSSQTQGGDLDCLKANDTFRLDTTDAQDFIQQFVDIEQTLSICHKRRDTKNLTVPSLVDHLRHGDTFGACP